MSMSELHKPEWYGEYAVIKNKYNDYVQVEYKCNGTGSLCGQPPVQGTG